MILYLCVTVLVLLLAYFVQPVRKISSYEISRKEAVSRISFFAIFVILFLLSALRMEVGNDYKNYAITCHEIWVDGIVVTEPGFNILVKGIYTLLGGEFYIAVFAFFAFATLVIFLYVFRHQSENFFLSFAMFMLLGMYFRTFNTVRYYFVLAVALFAVTLVEEKKYFTFLTVIIFAAFFHKSVLFVIPVYLVAAVMKKKVHYGILSMAAVILWLFKKQILWLAVKLYPSYEDTVFLNQSGSFLRYLPGLIQAFLVLVLCLCFYKESIENNRRNQICFNLNFMAILAIIFGSFIPLLSRFTYYLTIGQLLLVPSVVHNIGNPKKKKIVTVLLFVICIFYFLFFLKTASEEGIRVLPYKTWIMEGVQEYIYANDIL